MLASMTPLKTVIAASFVAIGAIVGLGRMGTMADSLRGDAQRVVIENMPFQKLVDLRKAKLHEDAEQLARGDKQLWRLEKTVASKSARCDELKQSLENERSTLALSRLQYESGAETITVDQKTFSRADIERDMQLRLVDCEQLEKSLQEEEGRLREIQNAVANGRKARDEFAIKLASDRSKLEQQIAQGETAAFTKELRNSMSELHLNASDFDRKIEDALDKLFEDAAFTSRPATQGQIPWDVKSSNVMSRVDTYLQRNPSDAKLAGTSAK